MIAAEDGSEVYVFDETGQHLRTLDALTGALRYQFGYDQMGRLITITDGDGNITTIERDANGHPTSIVGPYGQRTTLTLNANGYLASITNPANESVRLAYTDGGLLISHTDPKGNTHRFGYDDLGRLIRDDNPAGGFQTLSRTDSPNGYTVALSTALGRTTTYEVEILSPGGQRRVTIFPNGLRTELTEGSDGTRMSRFPDGTVINLIEGPDPRWGKQAPLPANLTARTPGGILYTGTMSSAVSLTDPSNPLSLATRSDTVSINGLTYTSTYSAATRELITTTPEGRKAVTILDAKGRVMQEQVGDLFPASYNYDDRGRLSTITLGTGPDARIVSFSYNTAGDLATITDPLGRTAHFEYDAVGRVTQHTFADGRMIRYAYDANGNVIAVTPPGRPPHTYAYTPLNLLSVYTPPHVGASADQTLYTYNADGDLSRITRPDGQIVNFGYDNAGQLTAITLPRGQVTYAYAIVNDWLKDGKGTDREEFARKELLKKFQNPERKEYEDLLKQAEETGEKGVDPIGKKFRELFRKINKALCGGEGEPPPEQQRPSPQKKLPNTKLPPGYNPDPRSQY